MRLPAFLRRQSRLAVRVYAVGLVQFVVVAAAMEVDHHLHMRPPPSESQAQFVSGSVARVVDDPGALQAEVDRASATFGWTIDVREPDGRLLAHAEPRDRSTKKETRRGTLSIPVREGLTAKMDYVVHPRPDQKASGPPWAGFGGLFVLFVVGVASWLIARSVVRPVHRLAEAARAFGEGHFDARADVVRSDEIGETARAFNDMADRIAKLLLTERELLANVSHELRTPLARIRVALDLANEGDARIAMTSLAEIAQDLAELERIVDDVLASARLALDTSGPSSRPALPMRAERIDARTPLEKSAAKFRSLHPKRPLRVELDDTLPEIKADAVLMRRVFDNLLDNAHKYTERADEPILLHARNDGDDLMVEVSDRGIGIAKDDMTRLFEPFFRADRSRTRATGGLGLGLALVRRVVLAHEGSITFESEPGRGTVARVRMPRFAT